MQMVLVEVSASRVAIKVMHGAGRRMHGTKQPLFSLKA